MEVRLQDFVNQMVVVYASFPDYDSHWESVKEDPSSGSVMIKNFTSSGTHTGAPFAFGPFPPVAAQGAAIKDDPIDLHVLLNDAQDKVVAVKPVTHGAQIGPASYYAQVGGMLI